MSNENPLKNMTAAQKIEALQVSVQTLDQAIYNMSQQMNMIQEALTLLNDKVNSMVIAMSSGLSVNDEVLNQISLQEKTKEMEKKVQNLLDDGMIEKSETTSKTSFVVVREIGDSDGSIINPRMQFVLGILDKDSQEKMLDKKAGDMVKLSDDATSSLELVEVYNVVTQKQEESVQE